MDPHVVADVNQDGAADICFAKPRKRNPKVFGLTCMNVAREKIVKIKLGRLYNAPLALRRHNQPDNIVLYKSLRRKGRTDFLVYSPDGSKPLKRSLNAVGKVIVGDWAGTGSQQVGVIGETTISYVDPIAGSEGSVPRPAGTVVDCYNNFNGPGERRIFTSKNVCKALNCKRS
jgi:hypothetical protein